MTKNILLAATALSALAFAGSASAIDITSATVSGVVNAGTTGPTVTTGAYRLASESVIGSGLPTTATTSVTSTLSTGAAGLAVGTYVLRFDYTGIAGFPTVPVLTTPGSAGCAVGNTLSSGGGSTQNFVEYAVTVSGTTCTTNPSFVATGPFRITTLGAVTVKSGLTLSGVGIDNSASAVFRTIVGVVAGYTASISGVVDNLGGATDTPVNASDNADFPTRLALGTNPNPYQGFSTGAGAFDAYIGSLGYAANANTYLELDGQAGDLTTANTPAMAITVNGALTGVTISLVTDDAGTGPIASTTNTGTSATFSGVAAGRYNVRLAATNTTTAAPTLGGGNYNAAFAAGTNVLIATPPAVGQTGLETINLEGTNFIAPWLQMQSANYTAIVRISNTGGTATGPITLTLRSNNGGTVNQTCQLTSAMLSAGTLVGGGIDQNRAIEFSGRTLANQCFGTTSTNADLQVTIQGAADNLSAKVRVINPNASVTETTIGRLNELGRSF